jgi:translation initiation factor IF-2
VGACRVIYDLLDEVRAAMEGRLAPVSEREYVGSAVVKAVFGAGSKRVVAGCGVEDGKLVKAGCPHHSSASSITLCAD